jgi:hypothetical protein
MSLLLVIFLLELVVQLVNTIGAKTINNLVRTFSRVQMIYAVSKLQTNNSPSYGASTSRSPAAHLPKTLPSSAQSKRNTYKCDTTSTQLAVRTSLLSGPGCNASMTS